MSKTKRDTIPLCNVRKFVSQARSLESCEDYSFQQDENIHNFYFIVGYGMPWHTMTVSGETGLITRYRD